MNYDNLTALAILSISVYIQHLNEKVVDTFASNKSRRKDCSTNSKFVNSNNVQVFYLYLSWLHYSRGIEN